MCQPTHKRYNVTITKVLDKYTESIVVDTGKTARRCIQRHCLATQAFISVKSLILLTLTAICHGITTRGQFLSMIHNNRNARKNLLRK
ncbi:hypothetical protein K1T71_001380 [Dendrolimus kikuchii]|uniref:Uncharacterized protein n=1 Tax=Dendrolimus kikuchii TaxID=765133 RepID=A0ACC1DHG0_9NEOP|nr:hypothetical protein K1T71_001380 [Dendrolimus kikuchii]